MPTKQEIADLAAYCEAEGEARLARAQEFCKAHGPQSDREGLVEAGGLLAAGEALKKQLKAK